MDLLSIIGICIAFGAILTGNLLEGGEFGALLNTPAAVIVFGGTLGATVLQTPSDMLRRAARLFVWVLFPPRLIANEHIEKVLMWSHTARREGLLGLENLAAVEKDGFVKKGLGLLADGKDPEEIRHQMETELTIREQRDTRASGIFDHMGGYAPTIGIIGAVMGLIHVMGNLEDPSKLGIGVATAFVATIYGVAFANLILFPIAGKLKSAIRKTSDFQSLTMEGILSIAYGENPKMIELKLRSFINS